MQIIKKTIKRVSLFTSKMSSDNVPAYSAYVSFFLFISAFPFIMALLAFIKYMPFDKDVLLNFIENLAPGAIGDMLTSWIHEIYNSSSGIMSISIIVALWSSSKGIWGIVQSINSIYGCDYRQNYFFKRFFAVIYTLLLIIIILASLALIIFGNKLAAWIGFTSVIFDMRIMIAVLMCFFIFIIIYTWIPDRKTKIRYELPGAVFTTAGMVLFSYIYSIYMDFVNLKNSIYGSLSTIILLLMWLYFCMYILFIGAEINVALSRRRKDG